MRFFFILFLLQTFLGYATGHETTSKKILYPYTPWFTGPLLAPTSINMKPGHPAIQPLITVFNIYGRYDSNWDLKEQSNIWSVNPLIDFQFGITDFIGLETIASFITNIRDGRSCTHFQDVLVLLGYQISNDIKGTWVPDMRCFIQQVFPLGNYKRLDPRNLGLDSTGDGSFQTGPLIAIRKLFYLPRNFLSLRGGLGYLFPTAVKVSGFNAYGGGYKTKGKVLPGQTFVALFSGEYSITQRWVFAFDSNFFYQKKSSFRGFKGMGITGDIAEVGLPSSIQIGFAPEIEYNFSATSGLIGGFWCTVAGRNTPAFASAFISYSKIF